MILRYFRDHDTFLGKNLALFSRDEYQAEARNVFHEHLVFAAKKGAMDEGSIDKLRDLIRASVLEVIKPDEIKPLMDRGLLSSVDHYHELIGEVKRYLSHKCNPRCLRRIQIKPGDGPECFRCRKPHPLRDSPDPTTHQYIKMKFPFYQSCIDALERCGIVDVVSEHELEFKHAYFCSTRHMPPCNQNATYNMSPVLTKLFILFLSMVNAQAIYHADGIAKYILK